MFLKILFWFYSLENVEMLRELKRKLKNHYLKKISMGKKTALKV